MPVTGLDLGKQLCDIFGLTGQLVYDIKIEAPVQDMATVTIRKHISDDELASVVGVLAKYDLVEREPA